MPKTGGNVLELRPTCGTDENALQKTRNAARKVDRRVTEVTMPRLQTMRSTGGTDADRSRSQAIRAVSVGAKAVGALALGAFAVGAQAIGALTISRLAIGRARIRRLAIDQLVIRQLHVTEELRAPSK